MADNEHVVKITADTSQAEQNLDATSKKLDEIDQKAKQADSSLNNMGGSSDASGLSKMNDELKDFSAEFQKVGEQYAQTMRDMGDTSGANDIEQEFQKIGESIENISNKASNINFDSTKSSVNELESEFDVLSQRAERLNETINMMNNFQAPTGQYKQMETDIESAENKLMQYMQEQQQMVENGTNINSPEWQQLQQNIDTTKQHVQELNSQMEELRTSGDGFNTTMSPDYSALESELQGLYDKYDSVEAKKQEFEELGLTGNALQSGYAEVDAELEKISNDMSEIIEKQDRMASEGTAFTPANDTAQFERYNESLAQTNMQMQNLQMQSQSTANSSQQLVSAGNQAQSTWQQVTQTVGSCMSAGQMEVGAFVSSLGGISSAASAAVVAIQLLNWSMEQAFDGMSVDFSKEMDLFNQVTSGLTQGMTSALSSVASKITSVFTNIAKKAFKKFGEFVKNATLELIGLGEHTNIVKKVLEELKNIWDQFINTMKSQIMRGISKLILEDLEEDLVVMAQFSDEFNEVMSDVIDAGKQLGLQLVAAIEPILNYLIPILTQAFEYIDWMMVQITKLTSALTGRDYYYEAIKGNSDYASSMDDSTASTDDYTQATNEATRATMNFQSSVMGFDKLNRLSGSSKGNGGSTGVIGDIQDAVEAVGIDKPTLAKMQEEADEISSIGDQIWDAINNRDWYKAGYLMGAAVEEAFGWLDDVLGWSKNAEKFTKLVNAIIDACNGFIDYFLEDDGLHALTVGKYIGDMLNTLIECFKMLLDPETGINFEGLGEAIGYALIGAIKEINWYDLGQLIIEYFQMIPRILVGLFSTDIGTTLGEGVAEGIKGFADGWDTQTWEDFFEGLFNTIFDFIIAVFSDTEPFFEIGEKFGSLVGSIIDGLNAETEGGDSKLSKAIEGIFSALGALISGFLTGFDVDAEDVETLVFNVLDGIANGFNELLSAENDEGQTITEKIGEIIKGIIAGVADSFEADDWVNLAKTIMTSLLDALGEIFANPDDFEEIGEGIADVINEMFGAVSDDLSKGTQTFNDKVDDELAIQKPLYLGIDTSIEGAQTGIDEAIENVGSKTEDKSGSVISKMISSIVGLITSLITNIDWSSMSDAICEVLTEVFDALDEADFWDSITDIINMFADIFGVIAERIPWDKLVAAMDNVKDTGAEIIGTSIKDTYLAGTEEALEQAEELGNKDLEKAAKWSSNPITYPFAQRRANKKMAEEIATYVDGDANQWRNYMDDMRKSNETFWERQSDARARGETALGTNASSMLGYIQEATSSTEQLTKDAGAATQSLTGYVNEAVDATSSLADNVSGSSSKMGDYVNNVVSSTENMSNSVKSSSDDMSNSVTSKIGDMANTVTSHIDFTTLSVTDSTSDMSSNVDSSMSDVTDSIDSNSGQWGSILGSAATPFYTLSDDVDGAMGDMTTSVDEETEEQKGIFSRMFSKLSDWCDNSSVHIGTTFGKMNKDSKDSVDDTQTYTDTVLGEISNSTALTSADIEGFVQDTDISQMNLIEIVQAMLRNILDVFKTIMQQIGVSTEEFVVEFVDVFSSMEDAVENLCLQLDTYLTRMEKRISDFYANTSSTNTNNLSVKQPIYTLSIPALAGGGVVGDGQLFLANEQGVEAITSGANGSATVTNNDQMVRAITKGVQQAVENAMGGESRDNGDIVILVDGEELARASARGSRSMNKRTNPTVSYSYY